MGLHHLCAIYLYGGCYVINAWEVGQTIALLHDISDVFVGFTKFFSESKYKPMSYFFFLSVISTWLYTRVLLLPTMIYDIYICVNPGLAGEFEFIRIFFCILLLCMWMLHCYWFKLFMVMLYSAVFKNKIEDL